MAVEAHLVSGPIGPDTIAIPGDPGRLGKSADGLREMCTTLGEVSDQLQKSAAAEDKRGRTMKSLIRVAGRTAQVLQGDADRLQELGDAVQHQADALTEALNDLDDLRGRWRQARHELRDALDGEERKRAAAAQDDGAGGGKGHGGGHDDQPINASAVIHDIDGDVADEHQGAIRRLTGLEFAPGGGGQSGAMLVDGEIDQAMTTYRREVRQILDQYTESIRRVHRADEAMAEHLPRTDRATLSMQDDDDADEPNAISGPQDIESVAEEAQQASQALDRATNELREIRLGIREGRMLPDDDRIGSSDGFQRTWTEHFDDLREDLNHARKSGGEVAAQLREIDHNGARAVWRSPGKG